MMASGATQIAQSAWSWYCHSVTNLKEQNELLRLDDRLLAIQTFLNQPI